VRQLVCIPVKKHLQIFSRALSAVLAGVYPADITVVTAIDHVQAP
jgi:hypothetical protein